MRPVFFLPLILAVSCQTITEPDIVGEPDPALSFADLNVVGYHTWWSADAWRQYDFGALDAVYFFSLEVGSDGHLQETQGWPDQWQDLITTARATGTAIIPSVTILDPNTYRSVFGDSAAVDTLLAQLTTLASDAAADGVHLDFEMFEAVSRDVRDSITDLVARLRAALDERKPEAAITMYTLAHDPADALDEVGLSEHLDRLVVQAYDLHWQSGDTAGPVAPLEGWGGRNWRAIKDRYEAMGIPRSKMLFTVPYFGYEWPTQDFHPGSPTTGSATILAYGRGPDGIPSARDRAALHGKLRDEASGSPYYAYQDSLGWRQGWFEDAESIAAKYLWVTENRLGGVAIFPLAYGDPDLMATLNSAIAGTQAVIAP